MPEFRGRRLKAKYSPLGANGKGAPALRASSISLGNLTFSASQVEVCNRWQKPSYRREGDSGREGYFEGWEKKGYLDQDGPGIKI